VPFISVIADGALTSRSPSGRMSQLTAPLRAAVKSASWAEASGSAQAMAVEDTEPMVSLAPSVSYVPLYRLHPVVPVIDPSAPNTIVGRVTMVLTLAIDVTTQDVPDSVVDGAIDAQAMTRTASDSVASGTVAVRARRVRTAWPP